MKTVVVIGASQNPVKFGNKAVRAFVDAGYNVVPINPKGGQIGDLQVLGSVGEVETRPDIMSAYLPPALLLQQLPDIARLGCDELWINPGAGSAEVQEEALRLDLKPINTCSILRIGKSPSEY
ncbi:CoA-binding protein [Verrucomicrobia bacterium]|nr:CoA-binding protein [Verrucomicrobiota bacterium]